MKISVLMSVYKGDKADDVKLSLDSILNQSFRPDQIVLVIDGPISIELQETLNDYATKEPIIELFPLDNNVGLGRALSIGLIHCHYDVVARMDSDDYSLPYRFEKQISFLENHPDIDVVGGQIAEFDTNMITKLAERKVPISMNDIARKMQYRNAMNHVTVMYKKDAVISAGNYQHCPFFEDYYLWCRMIKNGSKFHNLDEVLVNVRTGEGMYMRRGGKAYNDAIKCFQKKILELGIINKFQYFENLFIRLCVANMPNGLRGYIYKTKLRSKSNI